MAPFNSTFIPHANSSWAGPFLRYTITAWTDGSQDKENGEPFRSNKPQSSQGGSLRNTKVRVEIEICNIQRMQMYGVHFKRIKGDIWQYNRFCSALVSHMKL
jgi:hypothetical protein